MQVTAASIYHVLTRWLGVDVSLNDVCVFLPAGFSILACIFTGGIAFEAAVKGRKWSAFTAGCGLMSVIPAHLMRSVAGAFDNECIAVTAMTATFYWWVRSLRDDKSWPIAFIAALSYFYMVAAWGGYTFVLNMVGVHAAAQLVVNGAKNFSWNLYKAYAIFYFTGTALAIRVPVVGWMPLQSMEQMGPVFVLIIANLYAFVHVQSKKMGEREFSIFKRRVVVYGVAGIFALLFAIVQSGKVGPLSARVRGLFVPHTRTGNPLVDSVGGAPGDAGRRVLQVLSLQHLHRGGRHGNVRVPQAFSRAPFRRGLLLRRDVLLLEDGATRAPPRTRVRRRLCRCPRGALRVDSRRGNDRHGGHRPGA